MEASTSKLKWREERPFGGLHYFITVRAKRTAVIVRGWFRWHVLTGSTDRRSFWRLRTAQQWVEGLQSIPDPRPALRQLPGYEEYQRPP